MDGRDPAGATLSECLRRALLLSLLMFSENFCLSGIQCILMLVVNLVVTEPESNEESVLTLRRFKLILYAPPLEKGHGSAARLKALL